MLSRGLGGGEVEGREFERFCQSDLISGPKMASEGDALPHGWAASLAHMKVGPTYGKLQSNPLLEGWPIKS